MELLQIGNYFVTYQRAGNDKNGNPIFLVNIFLQSIMGEKHWFSCNHLCDRRMDKNGNIRLQSYNIEDSIKQLIKFLN